MTLFGYDTGVVSGAMVLLRQDIPLSTSETETVVSITMLFAAMSTVLGIPMNAALGRRPVIIASALLFIGASLCVALATGLAALLVGRAVLGVSIGLASGTVPMYSAELAPREWRGVMVTLNDLNIVCGQLLAALVNVCFERVPGGWRWSMGLAAVPAVLMFVGCLFLPESPRWLAMRRTPQEAEAVLKQIYKAEDVPGALEEILLAIKREEGSSAPRRTACSALRRGFRQVGAIWATREVRRAAILGIGLMAMNQFSGINTVMYYSTTILQQAGFSRSASLWLAATCCAAQLLGVCVSVASMDSAGRRPTALRSCAGVVVALAALVVAYSGGDGAAWDMLKVVALMGYLVAFGSGLSGVPWVMNAEIYPLRLRATAVGQATVACWVFNWIVGRYFLTACELLGTGGAFALFAAFSALGGAWMYLALPETRGLELEAVGRLFRDPVCSPPKVTEGEVEDTGSCTDSSAPDPYGGEAFDSSDNPESSDPTDRE